MNDTRAMLSNPRASVRIEAWEELIVSVLVANYAALPRQSGRRALAERIDQIVGQLPSR